MKQRGKLGGWLGLGLLAFVLGPATADDSYTVGGNSNGVVNGQQVLLNASLVSRPSAKYEQLQNSYLRLRVRYPETLPTWNVTTSGTTTTTTYLGYSNFRGGRVMLSTVGGDPFTTADNNKNVVTGSWLTQARINLNSVGSLTAGENYEVESLYQPINAPGQDPVLVTPNGNGNTNEISFTWQIRDSHPTITAITRGDVELTNGGLTGSTSSVVLSVKQTYRLIRDMVRMEVEVTNLSTTQQVVGVEQFIDPTFGSSTADGQPMYVGTVRTPLTKEFSFPSTNSADEAGLRQIPGTWRTFDQSSNPAVILGGQWTNNEIKTSSLTAGTPDATMLVNADLAGVMPFGYVPASLSLQNSNWATMARWTQRKINPNSALRFITYFGLAGPSTDISSPYALSVEAPYSLALATATDGTTSRTPNPFQLRVAVTNVSNQPLSNVALSLALPDGFSMVGANDTITKTISSVPVGTEQYQTWTIQSSSTQQAGVQTITVTSSGSGLSSKVVSREIGIPALPTLDYPSVTKRLDMISIPYDFNNRDLQHVLNSLGTLGVTGGGSAAVARYNPGSRSYAFFPDSFITSVSPGQGMWLFNGSLAQLQLPSDRIQLAATSQVGVALTPDWNQIGCPYTVPTRLFDTQVVSSDNTTRTFTDAVNAGIVRPVLYEYVPDPSDPSKTGQYTFSGDSSTVFNPWRGYWLRVLQSVTLVYNATSLVGPFRNVGPDYLRLRNGWEVPLEAVIDGATPARVRLGLDSSAQDGFDTRDVDMPPAVGGRGGLRLAIAHNDWGTNSGYYLRDIRGAAARGGSWYVESACEDANQDVTLRWNLRQAPADVQFTLVDLQTGVRRRMRTTTAYSYNTGAVGGVRAFQVLAERRSPGSLAVPMMTATPTRGRSVTVAFWLTEAATVEVLIESPTGRRVRTLATGLAGAVGQNTVGWDGRDDQGRPVPAGQYRCRVLVHTDDGQQVVAERIVVVSR